MRTEMYWIAAPTAGRLAIMPRPRGGDWLEDEVRIWHSTGVDVVLSLLTPDEVSELNLAQEKALCEAHGIEFITLPIADRGVPFSRELVLKLLAKLANQLVNGKNIAIHCRQGIGRAALMAICLLVVVGLGPETAQASVSAARGCPVPETLEQERWIAEFVKEPMVIAAK